ncbi:hypothetical protein BDW67DRAFT_43203 [Aspergillus spinulosporus]
MFKFTFSISFIPSFLVSQVNTIFTYTPSIDSNYCPYIPLKHSPIFDLLLRQHMFYSIYADLARCCFPCLRIYLCLFPHRRLAFPWALVIWCMLGQGYIHTICLQVSGYS